MLYIIFVMTCTFISCNEHKTSSATEEIKSTFDLADAKRAIDSLNVVYSNYIEKADSAGLASMYTSDAKLMMQNGSAVEGRAQIQTVFNRMFTSLGAVGITPTVLNVWGMETLVAEEGSYLMTDKGGKQIDKGKFLILWRKKDGIWRIFRDISNTDNPPPTSK